MLLEGLRVVLFGRPLAIATFDLVKYRALLCLASNCPVLEEFMEKQRYGQPRT